MSIRHIRLTDLTEAIVDRIGDLCPSIVSGISRPSRSRIVGSRKLTLQLFSESSSQMFRIWYEGNSPASAWLDSNAS